MRHSSRTVRDRVAHYSSVLTFLVIAAWTRLAGADPVGDGPANLETPTLGGTQFWGDELVFHDWRIQRNVLTRHCRLLDGDNHRQAWGTFEQCRAKLDVIKRDQSLPPMRGRVVLLLHGMVRTRNSMATLAEAIEQDGDCRAICLSYPSTRTSISEHAQSLAAVIRSLEGVERIDFVAHSLGNLVIRRYLGDHTNPTTGETPDPRIRRIVMIGAPNHGPLLAQVWSERTGVLYDAVLSETGRDLAEGWADLEPTLATPACEFGIIAGGKGDNQGWSRTLPGDDDGTVSVVEARLAGAADFIVLPARHTFMISDDKVVECTRRFLQQGWFTGENKRQPIEVRQVENAKSQAESSSAQNIRELKR